MDRNEWVEAVWVMLRGIPTGGIAEELESSWLEHKSREKPVAAIFGPYDAGKSSLLKRLLFEDRAPIPSDITVSARRETFSIDEAPGATWTFRDSPGLAGGNKDHDQKALENLDLADLLIWVFPPQLVTSGKQIFREIATGDRFGVATENIARSSLVVVARIDEAGIDPAENRDGFNELSERKKIECHELLSSMGASSPRWGINLVSADPYQVVGNDSPDAELYAIGSGWDGIAELETALTEARKDILELRNLSSYRFASRAISVLSQRVHEEQAKREEARLTAVNELERVDHCLENLDVLKRKCAADLERDLEEELLSANRRGHAAADTLSVRLSEVIDRWGEHAYAELDQLIAVAGHEAVERAKAPATTHLKDLFTEMEESEDAPRKSRDDAKLGKRVGGLGRAFRESFKAYARKDLGMSLDEAAKRIREFTESGQTWDAYRAAKNNKPFASEDLAEKAGKYVKWGAALDVAGPLVEQLGPLLYEIGNTALSAREAEIKARKRQEIRDKLRCLIEDVGKQVKTGFDITAAQFATQLEGQKQTFSAAKGVLDDQLSELVGYEVELKSMIASKPR